MVLDTNAWPGQTRPTRNRSPQELLLPLSLSLVAAGLLVGLLMGLTSVGGGSLMTPILVLVLKVNPVLAVGTDLVYQTITRLAGSAVHVRQRTSDLRVVAALAAGSLPGITLANIVLLWVPAATFRKDNLVLMTLAVALFLTAVTMVADRRLSPRRRLEPSPGVQPPSRPVARTVAVGFVVGALVGLTSVGAGSLALAGLTLLYPHLRGRLLVGTDLTHGVLLVPVGAAFALGSGHVDLGLAFNLAVGSIPGVILGSRLSLHVPERPLRLTMAGMLAFTAIRLVPAF